MGYTPTGGLTAKQLEEMLRARGLSPYGSNLGLGGFATPAPMPDQDPLFGFPQGPFGSETQFDGTTRGSSTTTSDFSRELPEDVRQRYVGLVDRLLGQKEFGFSPEELDALLIGPEERRMLLNQAGQPIAGAAQSARDMLLRRAANRGQTGSSSVAAAVQEIQREQGRQAGQAGNEARMGILAGNRAANLAAANARLQQESDVSRQAGGLLSAFPEYSSTGVSNQQTESQETSTRTTLPTSASGGRAGSTIGGGRSGVAPKRSSQPQQPGAPKRPAGGFFPMLP